MAILQFHLTDESGKGVTNAKLLVSCKFKNGETWQSDPLTTDAAGMASLEVKAALIKRFDWSTASFKASQFGHNLTIRNTTGPKKNWQRKPNIHYSHLRLSKERRARRSYRAGICRSL